MAKYSKLWRHVDGKTGKFFNNNYKSKKAKARNEKKDSNHG